MKEALAMMDDQILPDDPQELALFVKDPTFIKQLNASEISVIARAQTFIKPVSLGQDLQAKVEETSAAIAAADTIPGDVSEDRASEGLMVKEETENASPEHGGQKNVTPEESCSRTCVHHSFFFEFAL